MYIHGVKPIKPINNMTTITKYQLLIVRGLFSTALLLSLFSCSSSNNDTGGELNIPTDNDEECCSLIEEAETNTFLDKLSEVEELSQNIGDYIIKVYSTRPKLYVGYNDLYFAVEKRANGRHVKDIEFSELSPLMTMNMGGMPMQHSTPLAAGFTQVLTYPIYHTWVSFLMASDTANGDTWELPFRYRVKDFSGVRSNVPATVQAAPDGTNWLKSFKYEGSTYYLSIVNPQLLTVGINTLQAYVSKQGSDRTKPYPEATETFTIEHVPTMPDMGDHTSPNNEPLVKHASGVYEGKLNLSMTGLWNIHLVVKDKDGNTIAGGDNDNSGYSDLYWSIII